MESDSIIATVSNSVDESNAGCSAITTHTTSTETAKYHTQDDRHTFVTPKVPFRSHTKRVKKCPAETPESDGIAEKIGGMMAAVNQATTVDPIALVISDRLAPLNMQQKYHSR